MTTPTIDLTGDSDETASPTSSDEDLRRAIAISLEADQTMPNAREAELDAIATSPTRMRQVPKAPEGHPTTTNSLGILGIDRKQQEQERLERLKRKRGGHISPSALQRTEKLARIGAESSVALPHGDIVKGTGSTKAEASDALQSSLQFPHGVVKKTWAFGYLRDGDDIKIEEVFQRGNLQSAVLSSFQWDFDWLFPKFDTKGTKFVLVMQAKFESQRRQLQADFDDIPNVRLCFPSMEGQVICMHSKLMLLFYNTHLRLVVPTANLVPYDWGETGVMENTVFLIDLPKIEGSARSGDRPSTSFKTSLMCYLKATGLPDDVLRKVCEHDFLQTAKIGFVHTIGGAHLGNDWKLTGLCGLGRTLDGLGLRTSQDIKVDFITSSIGSLNEEFLRSIYLAAQGDDGLSEYALRNSKKLPTFVADDTTRRISKETGAKWKTNFRFYYPSDATVRESKGGPDSAGTICFNERWWNGAKFPQRNMLDCVSRRPGMLMHNKMLFARFRDPTEGSGTQYAGWVYCGSANLSESAWGRLVQDRASKHPKLNCRNWECGVVIPVKPVASRPGSNSRDLPEELFDFDMFAGTVPIPIILPGKPVLASKPWFNDGG